MEDFTLPIAQYARTHLLTARAAARRMLETGSGVILMMTTRRSIEIAPLAIVNS